ncbi:unnamed protein product [Bursaphelenchus xylophilus]|uniref:(pine wood nematode) hypothetical protein n=1 Tax=Bursaphelenchus xylophilus TaxID=6326 RepID=A0A1I7SGI5_BURXY|nr:unnamed protein product [Bursaphelenchus xylophilus]CAG9117405.1 unnamed protein product [Bursaphelenchus xylophilus]
MSRQKNIPFLSEYDKRTFGPLVDQLKPFTNKKFFGYLQKGRAEELGVATLTHADLHSGNVMTKPNPDGSPSDEVATFFDWQLGFFGNALFDLARFACVSADADIRRGIEDVALDEYYDAYIKHSERPDPKFTRDVCQELYDLGIVMEALEFQFLFHLVSGNLNPRNDRHLESLLARFALRARLTMEDGIRAIEKYKLLDVAKNKCLKTV